MLENRKITVAVTGGIAAYKACEVVRGLKKLGADVRVAMTENATRFVGPVTFEALSGHPVATTEWKRTPDGAMPHIDLNLHADLILVVPATANILAKAARGIADDLVSALVLAHRAKIAFVPAMNCHMWRNPATQRNIEDLRRDGAVFFGPDTGWQACGDTGEGRMMEPAAILDLMPGLFSEKPLSGRRVLLTAGPTYEPIDDVRGITNRSSGRQGFALARAARDLGAEVTVVAGPVTVPYPAGVRILPVVTAEEMLAAVEDELDRLPYDLFIGVAAVADWRVANRLDGKWKKEAGLPALALETNPDILATVGHRDGGPVTIGFAAEASDLVENAYAKLAKKGAAMIVANLARDALGSDENRVLIVTDAEVDEVGPAGKDEIARKILYHAVDLLEDGYTDEDDDPI